MLLFVILDKLTEKDVELAEKLQRKMRYEPNNVTLDEWSDTFKSRNADLTKVITSPEVVKFFEKWPLYVKRPDFVSKSKTH